MCLAYPETLEPRELADVADCPVTLLVSENRSFSTSSLRPPTMKRRGSGTATSVYKNLAD